MTICTCKHKKITDGDRKTNYMYMSTQKLLRQIQKIYSTLDPMCCILFQQIVANNNNNNSNSNSNNSNKEK